MADTNFVLGTVITEEWLNDTNNITYGISSTDSGKGAALVGLQDAAGRYASTHVEGALAEVGLKGGEAGQAHQASTYTAANSVIVNSIYIGQGSASSINNTVIGRNSLPATATPGESFTALGYETLSSVTTGDNLTAIGRSALRFCDTGINNTAVGVVSLENNTSGSGNTAIGVSSLVQNTTGSNNTGLGFKAGFSTTTGSSNTSVGTTALQFNVSGSQNTSVGYEALTNNTSDHNTAVGYNALIQNTSGARNTGVGRSAGFGNQTGTENVSVGYSTMTAVASYNNSTAIGTNALVANQGSGNTAVGRSAGTANTTGGNNIFIGASAGTDAVDTVTTGNNRIVMGNNSHTTASIKIAWTVTSDARDKVDFAPVPHGLDFVLGLQPIAYRFRLSRETEEAHGPVRYGFKAQDVLALEGETPVIINAENPENLKYNESCLIPVLVQAIKELSAEIALLKKTNP